MVYNLDTGRGQVTDGRASHQRKYYRGSQILLDSQKALHAQALSLSTCDRDHVHYDFLCQNVKVLENDKAIGRSVTFRIGPVPLFWVPFFVFPVKQGRHSGLLTPSVGSNSRDGLFIRNLGYYHAESEYWDTTIRGTFRERGGFLLESRTAYNIRNRLSGSVDLDYDRQTSPAGSANNFRIGLQHQQRLNTTTNIRGNGTFATSTDFDRRNSNSLFNYLNRQLRSSISLDKRWTESNRSLDGSLTYYRDLAKKRNSFQGFPRLSFRQGRRPIFGREERTGGLSLPWYKSVYYNLSGNLNNNWIRDPDPENNENDLTLQGLFSVNSQHRLMDVLDFNPSFSLNESFSRNDQNRPTRRGSYNASLSSGTTLYGIFRPQIGSLRGIRHRLQPRVNFNYSQSGTVSGGSFGFGGTRDWTDPRRSLGLNLSNSFDIKTEHEGQERRTTLATLNFSTGYDFDTPGFRKWRDLRTNASVKPSRKVDVRLNMTHTLYDNADSRSLSHPRLRNFTVTSNFRFQGRSDLETEDLENRPFFPTSDPSFGFERNLYDDFADTTQPWRFNLTHYFRFNRGGSGNSTKQSWIKADFGFNPTQKLRADYSLNIDLAPDRRINAQSLSLYYDLHCWETRFSWYPTGFNKGFFFKINIKDIPQIKLEHRRGGFGL